MGEKPYSYSGIHHCPFTWNQGAILTRALGDVVSFLGHTFNSCLANYYRDGSDSVAWHSDDEVGVSPVIASVSLGAPRRFILRNNNTREKIEYSLGEGSLLVMGGDLQKHWQHRVPKTKKKVGPRLNLTFRQMA